MKKQPIIRRLWLPVLVAAVCAVSGCGTAQTAVRKTETLTGAAITALPADMQPLAYADEADGRALAQMQLMLENTYAQLYLGNRYDIAVRDRDTGAVFFSNRAAYDESALDGLGDLGVSQALSQLELDYADSANHTFTMYSYPDAADDKGKQGITAEVQNGVLHVTYAFGEKELNSTVCVAYTPQTFAELKEKGEQLVQSGELSRISWARFCDAYMEMTLAELTGLERASYLDRYPGLEALGAVYVLKDNQTDVVRRVVLEVSRQCGINAEVIRGQMAQTGAKENVAGDAAYFTVGVVYRLDGRDLIAEIDPKTVECASGYYLTRIGLLGSFGAAKPDTDGYLFIPDNSGAVIENTEKPAGLYRMELPFYGSDFGLDMTDSSQVMPNSVFPVFGIKENDRAVFGIAESGEANGGVTACADDGIYPYYTVRPWVNFTVQDTTSYGSMLGEEETRIFAAKPNTDTFRMRYHFLYGDEAAYAGMARYYRRYLLESGRMQAAEEPETLPLQIDFIGAITKKQKVMGIPAEVPVAVSDMEGIGDFVRRLSSALAQTPIHYVLCGAVDGGMDQTLPQRLRFEKTVGSRAEYTALADAVAQTGGDLALAVDFMRVYKDGSGLQKSWQLSRFISKDYAFHAAFLPATGLRVSGRQGYWLAPSGYAAVLDTLLDSGDCADMQLYMLSAGGYLSGNYSESDFTTREAAKRFIQQAAQKLQSSGVPVTAEGANAYMLPYTDRVTDIPFDGGDHQLESYAVPFVGMVLRGSVSMCGPALNLQSSYKTAYLKCVESGSGLHYRLITGDQLLLAQTAFSDLFSVSAADWLDVISADYRRAEQALDETAGTAIADHRRLADGVFCTEYENGVRIFVNYTAQPQTINGVTVPAMDFAVKK